MKIKKVNELRNSADDIVKPSKNEINEALEYIKGKHNGEIPYKFGPQEYGRWMAEYANYMIINKERI